MIDIEAVIRPKDLQRFYEETGDIPNEVLKLSFININGNYQLFLVDNKRLINNKVVVSKNNTITEETLKEMKRIEDG